MAKKAPPSAPEDGDEDQDKEKDNRGMIPLGGDRFSLIPRNLDEGMKYAELICKSAICPPAFQNKAGDVMVAVQMGLEVGLAPLQAIQNIAVINGRPTVWGDAALAVVMNSPAYESHNEPFDEKTMTATAIFKRRGNPKPFVETFSQADAEKAGLWKKQGPWTNYPKRMLAMRARGFAMRNGFADALRGMAIREEVEDYVDTTVVSRTPAEPAYEEPKAIEVPMPNGEAAAQPKTTTGEIQEADAKFTEVKAFRKAGVFEFTAVTEQGKTYKTADVDAAKKLKASVGGMLPVKFRFIEKEGEPWIQELLN